MMYSYLVTSLPQSRKNELCAQHTSSQLLLLAERAREKKNQHEDERGRTSEGTRTDGRGYGCEKRSRGGTSIFIERESPLTRISLRARLAV